MKIAFVGAGSLVFTRKLVSDLLRQDATADAAFSLIDIHEGRLRDAQDSVESLVRSTGRKPSVEATTSCQRGVSGADYVINTIRVGGPEITRIDFDVPECYGVHQTIADTHGIGGISRAFRTIPQVLQIAAEVERESRTPGSSTTPIPWQ